MYCTSTPNLWVQLPTGRCAIKSEHVRAKRAVHLSFIVNGFAWGSYIVRIPDVKQQFEITNSQLGLTLLAGTVGVLLAMKPSGTIVAKYGSSQCVIVGTALLGITLFLLGFLLNYTWLVCSLFALGACAALHDIAMNTHGSTLEKVTGQSMMNGFHARFSIGGFLGAAYGGACSQFHIRPLIQLGLVAFIYFMMIPWLRKNLLPTDIDKHDKSISTEEPRERAHIFYALGLLGFFASVCEGAASDWGAVLLRDTWNAAPFVSSIPYIVFSITMLTGRLYGDRITKKFSREWIVRWGGAIAGAGLIVGLLIGGTIGVSLGWAVLGLGVSVAIPSVFSAAGQIASTRFAGHVSPAAAVAVVGGVSYAGFLVGPPLIGFLADIVSLRWAMIVPALLALAMSASSKIVAD